MRYGSLCSGIEAASVAFGPLGWEAAWFSEIEAFPNAVLAHHYPGVANHGDMTTIRERILSGEIEATDMICGGPPCQAFSVAGLRRSLDDERGNLTLEYVKICDATDDHHGYRPQFTTSELGQVIPKEGSTLTTALCSVLHAIAGCIPEQTLPESFCIAIEVGRGYTNIPWRGKPESPDGNRYKALGNSWAVPCARWIGERIKAIRP